MVTASSCEALAFSPMVKVSDDRLGALDYFQRRIQKCPSCVDLGDGRQEGALFETLVRARKTESQMVAESS